MSFNIDSNSDIVIYGANQQNILLGKEMIRQGFHVCFYIDKKASSIQTFLPVLTLKEVLNEKYNTNYVVIIGFQNAIHQEKVAHDLYEKGFDKLVFLPMFLETGEKSMYLRNVYQSIMDYHFKELNNIPQYTELLLAEPEVLYLKVSEHSVIVSLPIDILYTDTVTDTNPINGEKFNEIRKCIQKKYADIPIYRMFHYFTLFKYLDTGKGNCNEYLQLQLSKENPSLEEKDRLLTDRYELYKVYESAFEQKSSFFIDSAIPVKWNKKGYFNIKDGHHRAVYLIYKGYKTVPVVISRDDWQKYYKLPLLKRLPSNILTQKSFFHITSLQKRKNYVLISIVESVIEHLSDNLTSEINILDMSQNKYYVSPALAKFNKLRISILELDDKIVSYFDILMQLSNVTNIKKIDSASLKQNSFEYIFLDEETWKINKEQILGLVNSGVFIYKYTNRLSSGSLVFYSKKLHCEKKLISYFDI